MPKLPTNLEKMRDFAVVALWEERDNFNLTMQDISKILHISLSSVYKIIKAERGGEDDS